MVGTTSFYNDGNQVAITESASITSATLTEVLNISGSGVIQLGYIGCSTVTALTAHKCQIIIDGTTVVNETSGGAIANTQCYANVGLWNNLDMLTFGQVVFDSSLVINIAGDGTDGAAYFYKRYLT